LHCVVHIECDLGRSLKPIVSNFEVDPVKANRIEYVVLIIRALTEIIILRAFGTRALVYFIENVPPERPITV
jgi:hypothetical protein